MDSLLLEILYGVDWTEPWLLVLIAFHLLTSLSIFLLRHHTYLQSAILGFLALLCFFSERINETAASNYRLFSKEQYFDPQGFFILTVWCAPIILNCFLIVLCWLWNVWHMMVRLGRIKQQRGSLTQKKKSTHKVSSHSKQTTKKIT